MSRLQRVSVSVPLADATVTPDRFIPIFHDWIRRGAVEGMLIDVARYGHVHHGPGVMLIGHDGDYAIDMAGGRPSLRYTLKRDADGDARALVAVAARRLLAAWDALGEEGMGVVTGELIVTIADRIRAPNTQTTRDWIVDAVAEGVRDAIGTGMTAATPVIGDERGPLVVRVALTADALT